MHLTEKHNVQQVLRDLWADFFPHKNTKPADLARANANKEWLRDSLLFYGWNVEANKEVNIIFAEASAVLFFETIQACALVSISWTEPKLIFTYVDNRPQ